MRSRRIIRGVTKLQFRQAEQDKRLRRLAADIADFNKIVDPYREQIVRDVAQLPEGQRRYRAQELALHTTKAVLKRFFPAEYRLVHDEGHGMLPVIRTAFRYQYPGSWHPSEVLSAFIDHLEKLIKEGKHHGHQAAD